MPWTVRRDATVDCVLNSVATGGTSRRNPTPLGRHPNGDRFLFLIVIAHSGTYWTQPFRNSYSCNSEPAQSTLATPHDPETGAVVRPIHLATTFVQPRGRPSGESSTTRVAAIPTRKAFETSLASLGIGHGCLGLSPRAWRRPTASRCCSAKATMYWPERISTAGTYRLLHEILDRSGVDVTLAPSTDLAAFEAAIRPETKLIWIESPGNPLMSVTDIAACAEIARRHGVILGVDNTFATPVLTRPLGVRRRHRDALGHKVPGRT